MEDLREALKPALNYWAKFISNPNSVKFDNGDDSKNGAMATMLAMMNNQGTTPGDEDVVNKFKDALLELIKVDLDKTGRCIISVDYGPDMILIKSVEATGTKENYNFPWKTCMWINKEVGEISIKCSEGYRAETRVVNSEGELVY